ncbi:MAG: T9SS type A sorting domain-containing protein, partial [Bacteroidota bacterium]
SIATSGSIVHAVWEDNRDGNYNIYYKNSIDAGLSWGPDTRLTFATDTSMSAHIALSDSVVHVAWEDHRDGNYEIYYKRNPTGNIPVGIGNDSEAGTGQQISIYPNPVANFVSVELNNNPNPNEILSIRNLLGEELLSMPVHFGKTSIDVSSLKNGIYFVGIKSGNKLASGAKLIILK